MRWWDFIFSRTRVTLSPDFGRFCFLFCILGVGASSGTKLEASGGTGSRTFVPCLGRCGAKRGPYGIFCMSICVLTHMPGSALGSISTGGSRDVGPAERVPSFRVLVYLASSFPLDGCGDQRTGRAHPQPLDKVFVYVPNSLSITWSDASVTSTAVPASALFSVSILPSFLVSIPFYEPFNQFPQFVHPFIHPLRAFYYLNCNANLRFEANLLNIRSFFGLQRILLFLLRLFQRRRSFLTPQVSHLFPCVPQSIVYFVRRRERRSPVSCGPSRSEYVDPRPSFRRSMTRRCDIA